MVRIVTLSLALILTSAAQAAQERTLLESDTVPKVRSGRVFVPMRAVATALGAAVGWQPTSREVEISRNGRAVVLQVGETQATVDGKKVSVEVAPFVEQGRVMVPLRFAAEALATPVLYETRTASVLIGPDLEGVLWVLPLESFRSGIVVHFPDKGAEITSPVRVHGQANEFEGGVFVQLKDAKGKVLAEGPGQGMMGAFGPFTVELPYKLPAGAAPQAGRIILFAPSPKDGQPLDMIVIPVTLR